MAKVGCVCCRTLGHKNSQVEIHHIVRNSRRLGDDQTIPLCAYHHRGVLPMELDQGATEDVFKVSRHHHGRRAFEAYWGSEDSLLKYTNEILNAQFPA